MASSTLFILLVVACVTAISSSPQLFKFQAEPLPQASFQVSGPSPQQYYQPSPYQAYQPQQPYPYQQQQQQPGSARGGRELSAPQEPRAIAPSALTDNAIPGSGQSPPAKKYNKRYPLTPPVLKFRIGVISDLDQEAAEKKAKTDGGPEEPTGKWYALLNEGDLYVQQNQDDPDKSNITVEWDEERIHKVESGLAYSGRGMELSTLNVFNGHLYSCDDKTGVVYELPLDDSLEVVPIPWTILANGNNTGPNGFKCEWATIKDNDLWVGGHGTVGTNKEGKVVSNKNKFVKKITPTGEVTHHDWTKNFDKMADALEVNFPGYVTHESAGWSDILRKWIFMPRRVSKELYSDAEDGSKGSNVVLLADEDFGNVQVGHIGDLIPTHGFASFKFVPGTGDQMVVAIKSVEVDDTTETYIMAFDLKGNVLLPETKFADKKYEGVEFI